MLSNWAMGQLEMPPTLLSGDYSLAIVLTGTTDPGVRIPGQTQLTSGADRLTEALRLYHDKKIQKILITGGAASLSYPDHHEGRETKKLMQALGVDTDHLILEDKAKNTHENAKLSRERLSGQEEDILLITSAYHMRRAWACFQKEGLEVTPYPVDYRYRADRGWRDWLPSVDALDQWETIIKEMVGLVVYRLMGYL
jgi:uncharacterized SAM-binding protein YcdF (DUF218 family)